MDPEDAGFEVRTIRTSVAPAGDGDDDAPAVRGLGIVYDEWTEIFPGVKERIRRGGRQVDGTVKSFFNHDPSQVLSTLESEPALELHETDKGLEYVSPIPPTSYGRDLEINLERGNVRGSSFAFSVPSGGDTMWEDDDGTLRRDVLRYIVYEVGPVTDPAYVQTSAGLREARSRVNDWRTRQGEPIGRLKQLRRRQALAEIES